MRSTFCLLLASAAICVCTCSARAQFFTPKTIQFKGADGYSQAELMAASGLKSGALIDSSKLGTYGQRLLDTGLFSGVKFRSNGQDLIFELTPATGFLPISLDNLPLANDADLNARLQTQVPLFHGKVPTEGALADDVRKALEQILASQGLTASIQAAAGQGKNAAMLYTVATPPVLVGDIKLADASPALEPGAQQVVARLNGSPYHSEGTTSQISTYLGNYYHDEGYLEAAIAVHRRGPAISTPEAIRVPMEITVDPGVRYRLGTVQFAPDVPVTQADFDHQSAIHAGDIADGQHLTAEWEYVSRQFHNQGHMRARVHPQPSFDRTKGVVSFTVTADPGPVYTMGKLTIQNVSDELRTMMLAAWKMPAGATFNEGAIRGYFATHGVNPALERVLAAVKIGYLLNLNDQDHTVDVSIKLERKQ